MPKRDQEQNEKGTDIEQVVVVTPTEEVRRDAEGGKKESHDAMALRVVRCATQSFVQRHRSSVPARAKNQMMPNGRTGNGPVGYKPYAK